MKLCLKFLMIFMLFNLEAYAIQEKIVRNQDRIEVVLSDIDVNRIAILNDRIKAIYCSQDKVHIVTDEENGQIFVTPRSKGGYFGMSVVTESNSTIDLKVTTVGMASETILLRVDKRTMAEVSKEKARAEETIKDLVAAAFNGRVIKSYQMTKAIESLDKEAKNLVQKLIYMGSNYRIQVFEYKNLKHTEDILSEQTFKISGDVIAVSIAKKALKPGEITKIVVIENVKK